MRKKIIIGSIIVTLLMLITPSISAIKVNMQDQKIEEKIDNLKTIINKKDLKIDFFKIGSFFYWVFYSFLLTYLFTVGIFAMMLVGLIMGCNGLFFALRFKTGDGFEKFTSGFVLSFLVVLLPWLMSFHIWTDGRFMAEDGTGFWPLYEDMQDTYFEGVDVEIFFVKFFNIMGFLNDLWDNIIDRISPYSN